MIKFNKCNKTTEQIAKEIIDNLIFRLITNPICYLSIDLGVYKDINELVATIQNIAKTRYIDVNIDYDDLLIWSTKIDIVAKYNERYLLTKGNMFNKFLIIEKCFYNKIVNEKIYIFDFKLFNLNKVYILHALQTAFYHAGFDEAFVVIDGIRHRIEPFNYYDLYLEKNKENSIVRLEDIKYRKKIKEEHNKRFAKFIVEV